MSWHKLLWSLWCPQYAMPLCRLMGAPVESKLCFVLWLMPNTECDVGMSSNFNLIRIMCDLCLFCHHLRYGWDIDSVYLLSSLWWWLEIISPRREVYVPYNNTLLNNRLFCSWKCTGFMFTCFLLCLKSGSLWPYLLCWFDLFCVCIGSIHCGVDEKVKWMHVEWASLMCS